MASSDILAEYWRYRANKARAMALNPIAVEMQQEMRCIADVYDYLADVADRYSASAKPYSSHRLAVDTGETGALSAHGQKPGWKTMLDSETTQLRLKLEGYKALLAESSDAGEVGALTKLIEETELRLSVLNRGDEISSDTRSTTKSG